jgi:hypothetical protein
MRYGGAREIIAGNSHREGILLENLAGGRYVRRKDGVALNEEAPPDIS